jgi:hypothetical protein
VARAVLRSCFDCEEDLQDGEIDPICCDHRLKIGTCGTCLKNSSKAVLCQVQRSSPRHSVVIMESNSRTGNWLCNRKPIDVANDGEDTGIL